MMTNIAKSKIYKFLFIALCTVILAVCFAFGISKISKTENVSADNPTITNDSIKEFYTKNESAVFPMSTTVSVAGNEYDGTFSGVLFPNDTIYAFNSCDLSVIGDYSVLYSYKSAGVTSIAKKSFSVKNKLLGDFVGTSTITYGELEHMSSFGYQNGLTLDLADGDTFRFNQPLDLRTCDMYNLIHFFPQQYINSWEILSTRQNIEKIDVKYLYLILTDVYDPSNEVTLQLRFYPVYTSRQMTAATDCEGQGPTAIEKTSASITNTWSTYSQVQVNGQRYFVWSPSGLSNSPHRGTQVQDLVGSVSTKANKFDLSWVFDLNTYQAYFSNNTENEEQALDKTYSGGKLLISDLDDPNITQGAFKGFTTGEVFLSLKGAEYLTSSTKIEIGQIGNYSGEQLQSQYSIDDTAPMINIDKNSDSDTFNAVTYEKFNIFNAKASDVNLVGDVNTLVYYNYGSSSQTLVNINNNSFIPTNPGKYTILYTAKDSFNNVAAKEIYVNVIAPQVGQGKGINIVVDKISNLKCGEVTDVPVPSFISFNDDVNWNATITYPNGSIKEIDSSNTFIADEVGNYTIKYTYSDAAYNYYYSYNVTSSSNSNYFFRDNYTVQHYYIKYAEYTLDNNYVYSATNAGLDKKIADLYVKQDDGEYEIAENYKFTVTGNNQISYQFAYGEGTDKVLSQEYTAKIKDVQYKQTNEVSNIDLYDVGAYFDGDFEALSSGSGYRYVSNIKVGENKMEFINPLLSSKFSIKYFIPEDNMQFSAINFYLVDTNDENNFVKLTMNYQNFHTYFSVDDGTLYDITTLNSNKIDNNRIRTISYQKSSKRMDCNEGSKDVFVDYSKDLPELVYLYVELVGITGDAAVEIYNINLQNMNTTKDYVNPSYSYISSSGNYAYGKEITVYKPYVADVLSPVSLKDVNITVKDASNNFITDKNGLVLNKVPADVNYNFTAISDKYTVTYDGLVDGYNNKQSSTYLVYVVDFDKPVISFNDGSDKDTVVTVKLGVEMKIKPFTVTDNKSSVEKLNTYVLIIDQHGMWLSNVTSTLAYTPLYKGQYKVRVISVDEAGNMGVAYYQFIVE